MNDSFALVRAVRGPLILIALGVLFLLDQTASLPFTRTWPILFIIFGVLKLAERMVGPAEPVPPPPPPPPAAAWPPPQGGYRS